MQIDQTLVGFRNFDAADARLSRTMRAERAVEARLKEDAKRLLSFREVGVQPSSCTELDVVPPYADYDECIHIVRKGK